MPHHGADVVVRVLRGFKNSWERRDSQQAVSALCVCCLPQTQCELSVTVFKSSVGMPQPYGCSRL